MKTRRVKTIIALLIFSVVAFVGYQAYSFLRPRYTISYETTRILGPVDEDGRIDYCEAIRQIESEGVTTDNNAVVLLRKAYGRAGIAEDQLESYFQALGMDVPPEDADSLKSLHEFREGLSESIRPEQDALWEQQDTATMRAWSEEEFPLIAHWIETQETHMALVEEASRRPKYFAPLITEQNQPAFAHFPDEMRTIVVGRMLSVRGMLHLNHGRTDAAHEDSMTVHRLAKLIGVRPFQVSWFNATRLENFACHIDCCIAEYGELTEADFERFADDFETIGPIGDVVRIVDVGERFSLLSFIVGVADGESFSDEVGTSASGLETGFHCDPTLTLANELFDDVVAALTIRNRSERKEAFSRNADRLEKMSADTDKFGPGMLFRMRSAISEKVGNTLILLQFPGQRHISDGAERVETVRQLRDVAMALARWKSRTGTYPGALDELVPEYLADSPVDRFSGQPLKYDRRDDAFRIWSVGRNEEDDGGDESRDVVVQTAGYSSDRSSKSKANEPAEE